MVFSKTLFSKSDETLCLSKEISCFCWNFLDSTDSFPTFVEDSWVSVHSVLEFLNNNNKFFLFTWILAPKIPKLHSTNTNNSLGKCKQRARCKLSRITIFKQANMTMLSSLFEKKTGRICSNTDVLCYRKGVNFRITRQWKKSHFCTVKEEN